MSCSNGALHNLSNEIEKISKDATASLPAFSAFYSLAHNFYFIVKDIYSDYFAKAIRSTGYRVQVHAVVVLELAF
jgi:hypothetical protein